MKIRIEEYNPEWPQLYNTLAEKLSHVLSGYAVAVEHIGSTSIPGLAAKPIIDIAVGVRGEENFDKTIEPMLAHQFIYYEAFNALIPDRRLFVGLKDDCDPTQFEPVYSKAETIPHEAINHHRLCHVHVVEFGGIHWLRQLAFRDYLREHPADQHAYAQLKKELSHLSWQDGMAYNAAKEGLLHQIERKALLWYKRN